MKVKTLRNRGWLYTNNNLGKGKGLTVSSTLLKALCERFTEYSKRYIKETKECPFAFQEIQLHSMFAPAFADCADAFLLEHPVDRKWSKLKDYNWKDSRGRIDYWARKSGFDYLIEVKHSFDSLKTKTITQSLKDKWQVMTNQLDVLKDDCKDFSESSKGTFRVGIHVITFYENTADPQYVGNYKELESRYDNYLKSFDGDANWAALWVLKNELAGDCIWEEKESYPAVLFLVKVYPLV